VAPVRLDLRETRGGELGGHGLQHSDTLLHAALRDPEHRLLQMENEQGSGLHHVHPLLRLRRRLADVRVSDRGLPGVGQQWTAGRGAAEGRPRGGRGMVHRRSSRKKGGSGGCGRTPTGLVIVIVIVVHRRRVPADENSFPAIAVTSCRGGNRARIRRVAFPRV